MILTLRRFGTLMTLLLSPALFAQPQDPPDDKTLTHQAELVVTAQKREEKLSEVPLSLAVVDAKALEATGASNVREVAERVPNLFYAGFSAKRTSTPFIRGIGAGQGEPAVTTYLDGVPQLTIASGNLELLDLARVEVLRGPQGALYGRNTIGGLVHLISAQPGAEQRGQLEAELGNYSHRRFRGAFSGPIIDGKLFYQVAAAKYDRDGFTENATTGRDLDSQDSLYNRLALHYTPNDRWRLRLAGHAQKDEDGGYMLSAREQYEQTPYVLEHGGIDSADRKVRGLSFDLAYSGDRLTFQAILARDKNDVAEHADLDFTAFDILSRRTDEEHEQHYAELRLGSATALDLGAVALTWTVGASTYSAEFHHDAVTLINQPDAQVALGEGYDLDDDGLGLFGNARFSFGALDLDLGLRSERDNKNWDLDLTTTYGGYPLPGVLAADGADFDEWLPRLGLSYRFADHVMAYLNAAKSYRAGGYNRNTFGGIGSYIPELYTYDAETSWSYEAGTKAALMDERVYLAATVFQTDWDDRQLSVPLQGAPGQFYLDNAAASRSRGLELELNAALDPHFDLNAGLGTQKAEFETYLDPTSGLDVEGKRLPLVPEQNWNLGLNFHRGQGALEWTAHAGVVGLGKLWYDAANTAGEDDVTLLNARLGLAWSNFRLELWGKNLGDETYYHIAIPHTIVPGSFAVEPAAPRETGLTLGYRY